MADAKLVMRPTACGSCQGSKDGPPLEDPTQYGNVVGSLQYLMFIRPDVAFIVNKLSQFTSCPTTTHWTMAKCVLRYLAGTSDRGLFLRK